MLNRCAVYVDLPGTVSGTLVEVFDEGEDYSTVVINSRLNAEQQQEAIDHECRHYNARDFDMDYNVNELEFERHNIR